MTIKRYKKISADNQVKIVPETPYNVYEFDSEEEANEFESYVTADPKYEDPEIGDIVEHCFFINKSWEECSEATD